MVSSRWWCTDRPVEGPNFKPRASPAESAQELGKIVSERIRIATAKCLRFSSGVERILDRETIEEVSAMALKYRMCPHL